MEKDLIIGGASGYTWDHLKYWVNSIHKSGFSGDIVLCATHIHKQTIYKLLDEGVIMTLYGTPDNDGNIIGPSGAPHVARFLSMWKHLYDLPNEGCQDKYRYVIATDTRDVVFQRNPSDYLREHLSGSESLIVGSEGLKYKNEPWGKNNFIECFGQNFYELYKENLIYNVGTIAGTQRSMEELFLMIYQMSLNRKIPIVDQAVFNFLIHQKSFANHVFFAGNSWNWAVQMGTTCGGIMAGAGDIGLLAKSNPDELKRYELNYQHDQPIIKDGKVYNESGNLFTILHQYDRIPSLKKEVEELYGTK